MKYLNEVTRMLRQEFPEILPNLIWQNEDKTYSVFGKYLIVPETGEYRVFCSATDVGIFSSTRTALSWCIADKVKAYNTARELLETDQKLTNISNDIAVRMALAQRSQRWDFRDSIESKLESKIIKKKKLENQLAKCVSWAKYCQQRGFNNETQRIGRGQPNKTSRQGI
jgi:hypothetical protein